MPGFRGDEVKLEAKHKTTKNKQSKQSCPVVFAATGLFKKSLPVWRQKR